MSALDHPLLSVHNTDRFRHLAVIHRSVDELLDVFAPMLVAATARGDHLRAAVDDPLSRAIRERLGAAARGIVFGEPGRPYSYSGQTTAARRADRLRDLVGGSRGAIVLTDHSILAGHTATQVSASDHRSVVDASSNLALSGLPVTLICAFDIRHATETTEHGLYWNHPELIDGTTIRPNPRYRAPEDVLAATPVPPAPPLGPPIHELPFANGTTALRDIRAWTRHHGQAADLHPARIDGLVMAINELVSNSIEHGGGHGTLSWWTRPGRVVAQIHDPGHMSTTTPGLRRPDPLAPRGRGIWLTRQVSDILHLWTTPKGSYARLEIGA